MKLFNSPDSIWIPIFSMSALKKTLIIFSFLIFVLVVFLPSHPFGEGESNLFEVFNLIPEIKFESSKSKFPFPTAIGYGATLILSLFSAIIACFSRINKKAMVDLMSKRTLSSRFLYLVFSVILLVLPYFYFIAGDHAFKAFIYFSNFKRQNIFGLLIYCEACFFMYFCIYFVLFSEVTVFFKYLIRRIYGE